MSLSAMHSGVKQTWIKVVELKVKNQADQIQELDRQGPAVLGPEDKADTDTWDPEIQKDTKQLD